MAKNKGLYKELDLDLDKVPLYITAFFQEKHNCEPTIEIEILPVIIRYKYKYNQESGTIDFHPCKGGFHSINPKVGKSQETSLEISEYILREINSVLKNSAFKNGYSLVMIESDFNSLIEIAKIEDKFIFESDQNFNTTGMPKYRQLKISSIKNDYIIVKYFYNTNRMQIQGKQRYIFTEFKTLLSLLDNISLEESIISDITFCELQITPADIHDEMLDIFGQDLYDYLSKSSKKLISSSLTLSKVKIIVEDYSYILLPAAKGYEAFFKKVLMNNGIIIGSGDNFGQYFNGKTNQIVLENTGDFIGSKEIMFPILESMYSVLKQYRHSYSHGNATDGETVIIENKEIADEKLSDLLTKIMYYYIKIFKEGNQNNEL